MPPLFSERLRAMYEKTFGDDLPGLRQVVPSLYRVLSFAGGDRKVVYTVRDCGAFCHAFRFAAGFGGLFTERRPSLFLRVRALPQPAAHASTISGDVGL